MPKIHMHTSLLVSMLLILCACSSDKSEDADTQNVNFAEMVNPMIGNKGKGHDEAHRYLEAGYTYPGATYPFGMTQFTTSFFNPDKGFVINQLSGAGCNNMGNLPMLPVDGILRKSPDDMMGMGPHIKVQKAMAGYYKGQLFDDINTELTVTKRTGLARISYTKDQSKGTIIIGTGVNATQTGQASVTITADNAFQGSADGGSFCGAESDYKIYFAGKFDAKATRTGTWKGQLLQEKEDTASGPNSGAYFTFDLSGDKKINYKIGISYVSLKNAKENLQKENSGWNFDSVKTHTVASWNRYLGKIRVEGGTKSRRIQFYTALYHTFIHPSIFSDVNGQYIGSDHKVHAVDWGEYYTAFSNWDTYRTQIQLLSMLVPDITGDIIDSHIQFAQRAGGGLPRWVMADYETGIMEGDPSSILIANAYAFGAKDFDTQAALSVMRKGAEVPGTKSQNVLTRPHLAQYLQKGYTKASMSLEYTSADFAIGQFARQAGSNKKLYRKYLKRSANWKKLYNPKTNWLQSRNSDGSWKKPTDDWREASYKSYFWMIPYNLGGLIDTIGGKNAAEQRLDNFFRRLDADYGQPWFAAGNEPDFQVPWIYNWTNAPYKTQSLVPKIIKQRYQNAPSGLPGNDDLGAMGSWYVFANLGLYPMIPGYGGFSINSPSFSQIDISLSRDDTLHIRGGSMKKHYINALKVNGEAWQSAWLPYAKIANGGSIIFQLAKEPNKEWGTQTDPPSFAPGSTN